VSVLGLLLAMLSLSFFSGYMLTLWNAELGRAS
jgi:hypothetical protein